MLVLSLQRSRFILDTDVTCGVNPSALRRLLILHGVVNKHQGPALLCCLWKRISSAGGCSSVAITRFVLVFYSDLLCWKVFARACCWLCLRALPGSGLCCDGTFCQRASFTRGKLLLVSRQRLESASGGGLCCTRNRADDKKDILLTRVKVLDRFKSKQSTLDFLSDSFRSPRGPLGWGRSTRRQRAVRGGTAVRRLHYPFPAVPCSGFAGSLHTKSHEERQEGLGERLWACRWTRAGLSSPRGAG